MLQIPRQHRQHLVHWPSAVWRMLMLCCLGLAQAASTHQLGTNSVPPKLKFFEVAHRRPLWPNGQDDILSNSIFTPEPPATCRFTALWTLHLGPAARTERKGSGSWATLLCLVFRSWSWLQRPTLSASTSYVFEPSPFTIPILVIESRIRLALLQFLLN